MSKSIRTRATAIKICGVTRVEDARWLVELPIDAIGLNFHPASPRFISEITAREIVQIVPPEIEIVGVFVDRPASDITRVAREVGLTTLQLHGNESANGVESLAPWPIIKAFRMKSVDSVTEIQAFIHQVSAIGRSPFRVLVDAFHPGEQGGTGLAWDWNDLGDWRPSVDWFLAGGLNPDNVGQAIRRLQPTGIDVASGVERSPGIKDRAKVESLLEQARQAWPGP
ncbi:phosphoribosylanthranilate isomerase [bacterium]|jgi:phosphoribosylanthranilate isomerase|nr:phosphoribosylanthranilate isomerase [bacterium]